VKITKHLYVRRTWGANYRNYGHTIAA
jgi:hypothetical protein